MRADEQVQTRAGCCCADGAACGDVADSGASSSGRACAVIVAGGVGRRFGNPGGKLLVPCAGRPLMSWALAAFDAAASVGHIVVVCRPEVRDEMLARAIEPLHLATPLTFADAGAERQDSTISGLAAVPAACDVVAVHDAARPLVEPATIDAAVAELRAAGPEVAGVVCGQSAIDTLKLVEVGERGTRFTDTPDRARYWTVQTPQVFWTAEFRRACEEARAAGYLGTDDASLVEHAGGTVLGFEAPRTNIKVTVPEDLPLVEALLRERR